MKANKYLLFVASTLLALNAYAGALKSTCNPAKNNMCQERTFSSESARSSFIDLCRSHGGEVPSGSCPRGRSCTFKDGSTTYDYGTMPVRTFKENCKDQAGKYSPAPTFHDKTKASVKG